MDVAISAAKEAGADVLVAPFLDPDWPRRCGFSGRAE